MPSETDWQRRVRREKERAEYVAAHGNVCELCGNPPKSCGLSEDHDHRTNTHRGWLCYRCNRALPTYVDVEWLLRAALYLAPKEDVGFAEPWGYIREELERRERMRA